MRQGNRGAALLSVLLLVAVMAAIAATALDRVGLATRLAGNAVTAAQARHWLTMAELIATTRIEDAMAAGVGASGGLGREQAIALPDGATVRARVDDAGNCFNLNSLVEPQPGDPSGDPVLVARPRALAQFADLMVLVGIGAGEARRVAAAAADWIDSDSLPLPGGSERPGADAPAGSTVADRPVADASELMMVEGMTAALYDRLEPWICALPETELSPVNGNTLLPEQAPLLAMLAPDAISLARARAQLAARPRGGFASVYDFWQAPAIASADVPQEASEQLVIDSRWYRLTATVEAGGQAIGENALIDARTAPVRVVSRRWGTGA